jgi:hypothetical protein
MRAIGLGIVLTVRLDRALVLSTSIANERRLPAPARIFAVEPAQRARALLRGGIGKPKRRLIAGRLRLKKSR